MCESCPPIPVDGSTLEGARGPPTTIQGNRLQTYLSTADFCTLSLTEVAEKGSSEPFLVVKTLFESVSSNCSSKPFSAAKAPPGQAPTLSATTITSSVTWLRVRLIVVMNSDALGSRTC